MVKTVLVLATLPPTIVRILLLGPRVRLFVLHTTFPLIRVSPLAGLFLGWQISPITMGGLMSFRPTLSRLL